MDVYCQIADAINYEIGQILLDASLGRVYVDRKGNINWGKIRADIQKTVELNLCGDN